MNRHLRVLTSPRRSLLPPRALVLCALALTLFLLPSSALASHFRGGSIDWTVSSGTTVSFTVLSSWRSTFIGSDTLRYGDGASDPIGSNGTNVGTFTDSTGLQYTTLRNNLTHAYAGTGPWSAWYGSCCRIAGMGNGSNQSYRVEATVAMAGGNTGGPAIAAPAIIQMVRGVPQAYSLPVVDPDAGDTFTCAPSTSSQSALTNQPSWLSVSSNCVLSATPPTGGADLWAYSVRVTDSAGASSSFDGMIELINGSPPVCTGGGSFITPVGTPFSVSVTGTDSTGGTLNFTVFNGPAGGTLTPSSGPTGTVSTFDWTPTAADFGQTYAASIIVDNPLNLQDACPLGLTVPLNLPPTAEANGPYMGSKSAAVSVTAAGSTDSDGTIVQYEWDCDGDGVFEVTSTNATESCGPYTLGGTNTVSLRVTDDQGLTDTDTTTITVPNVGPTADAGGPYTTNQGVPVTIDGSGSTDGDGGTLAYAWDCNTGDGTSYTTGTDSFSCTYPDDGTYTGLLQVCDPEGTCDTGAFQVTSTNTLPTADAGGPYTTNQGVPVTLSGSSSTDPDGIISTYQWDCDVSDGLSFSLPSALPSFTCSYPDDGQFTATLRVVDDDGGIDDATALVDVSNTAAIANAGGPYTGTRNVALTVDGSGSSDPDGTITSWAWDCDTSDGIPAAAPSGSPTFSCTYSTIGTFTIELTVTDDDGASASTTTTATITNTDPVANAGGPYSGLQNIALTLDGSASTDPDGVLVGYEWDCDVSSGSGYSAPASVPTFVCTYATTGTYTASVRVTDDSGVSDTASATVTISNQAPTAEAGGPYVGGQGVPVAVFAFGSSDPEGPLVQYEWDCDGDGVYEISTTSESGTTCTFGGPGTYTVTLRVTDGSGVTDTDTATITIGNQAPIANAGGPYSSLLGAAVSVDGSGSTDLDGSLTDYAWDCDASDGVSLVSTGTTAGTTCSYGAVGTFTVTLQVTDDDGATDTTTTSVVVTNGAPVAVAGGPYTGNKGTAIPVDGTASSDADGTIVDYAWDCDGDGTADVSNATGLATCTFAAIGTYTITLVVTDDNGGTGTDTATVNVPLVGPIAFAGGPYVGIQGGGVAVDGSLSYDTDGAIVLWEWDCDGDNVFEQSSTTAATATCTPPTTGTWTVQLRVTDDDGAQDVDVTNIVVSNLVPVADAGGPYSGSEGSPVALDATGSADLDGFIATYGWDCDGDLLPDVLTSSATGATCTFAATGTYTVTLTVTDNDGGADVDTATVVIASLPPVADAGGPYFGSEGTAVALNGTGSSDVGGTIVQWEWDCDSDGTYDVVASAGLGSSCTYVDEGNFVVTLRVTDDDGDSTVAVANVAVANVDPTLLGPVGASTGDEGQQLLWSALATDPGTTDTLTYSWDFGDGTTSTGTSANHTYANEGVYTVTVTVDDGDGGIVSNTLSVTVANVAPVLGLTAIPSAGDEGQVLSLFTSATDAGVNDTLTYVWDMGDGNTVTGSAVTYTYADDGVFTVTVTASDDAGATDTTSSSVTIANVDPTIDALTGDVSGFEGQSLSWSTTTSDAGVADTLTHSWDFGDGTTATGTSASHVYVDEGQYVLTLTVTDDDGGSSSQSMTVTVANVAPVITTLSIPTGDEGTQIAMSVTATDAGANDTISYAWDFGDGTLAAGPAVTHTFADDGTFFVEVTATDNAGAVGSVIVDLQIANVAPTVTSTTVLPSATPDEGTEVDLVAVATDAGADDIPDLVYSWDPGDGSGVLAGDSVEYTYADDGVYTATVTVDDQDGGVTTSTVTITVGNVDPVISTSPPINAQQDTPYTYAPSVQDPGDEVFTWTLTGSVPTGMTVDALTGELAWTPTYDDVLIGTFAVDLTVDDGDGGQDVQSWTVTVFSLDTDGDGMPDDWEDDNGLDPLDPTDAADDPDADGITNLGEFGLDQDPWVYDGPSVPVAVSPLTGAEVTDSSPDLVVQNATDPQGEPLLYDFEVYLDAALTQLVTSGYGVIEDASGETLWAPVAPLVEDTQYWWTARANDPWTPSAWTAAESFTVNELNDAPDVPVLVYPIQGQFVTSLQPALEWGQTADPNQDEVTFDVAVYAEDGVTLVASTNGVPDSGSTTSSWVSDALSDNTVYTWTARAIDDEGLTSDWADLEEFFVSTENEAPDTPSWVSPADQDVLDGQSPDLVVTEVTDPEGQDVVYRFELDTDPSFTSADAFSSTLPATGTGEVTWSLADDARVLRENGWIYAKVTAVDTDGIESAPAVISFFVRGPNDAPAPPALISPADGSVVNGEAVVLHLGLSTDPEDDEVLYDLVLARDAALTDVLFEALEVPAGAGPLGDAQSASATVDGLLEAGEYFWSARAVDGPGAGSEWQTPNRFRLDATVGAPDPTGPECGCASSGRDVPPTTWLVALLPLALVLRRRRADAAQGGQNL